MMLGRTALGEADLDGELAAVAERLRASTVQVVARGGHGSGLIASADGLVVTNAHVANGRHARVITSDGRELPGDVVARAPDRDLAAIRLAASGLPVPDFRDTRTLRPGDVVIAAGNPLDLVGAITTGIVHSTDRRDSKVVADLRLLPGNSGGPLADSSGRVVGVNAMVVDGLAVAISASVVKRFLAAPSERPYLGIGTQVVALPVMGVRRMGLLVTELVEPSPASRAGVLTGDVVIGVDGRLLSAPSDLSYEIESVSVGGAVRLDVVRGGRVTGVQVVVGSASQNATAA